MLDSNPQLLSYYPETRNAIHICAFSQCGRYFAFSEDTTNVFIYDFNSVINCVEHDSDPRSDATSKVGKPENVRVPSAIPAAVLPPGIWTERTSSDVNARGDHAGSQRVPLSALFSIETNGTINHLAFGHGDITACRLPHRLPKRLSRVTKSETVCVLAIALSTGYIEVYNVDLLYFYPPPLAKMVLFDGNQPIVHIAMASDGSLRLASVSSMGVVKLWDIWDDGNMYVTLTSDDEDSTSSITSINDLSEFSTDKRLTNEISVATWHPFGEHLFLGDVNGRGLILQTESPYRCIALLRHHHLISAACYSQDGGLLITASFDGTCIAWAVPSYTMIHCYWHLDCPRSIRLLGGANDFHVTSLALSPDATSFATICEDGNLRIWPVSPSREPKVFFHEDLNRTDMRRRTLVFSPCGQVLAIAMTNSVLDLLIYPRRQPPDLFSLCLRVIRRCLVQTLLAPPTVGSALLADLVKSASALVPERPSAAPAAPVYPHATLLSPSPQLQQAECAPRARQRWSVDVREMHLCRNVLFTALAILPVPPRVLSSLCYGFVPGHSSFVTHRRSVIGPSQVQTA
uniref:WD repeat and SOCS box-containing protein 1 n=1 Tax=Schistocephalus solidus TaxID=70667 RepID=A0A0X3Q3F2_SCHSO